MRFPCSPCPAPLGRGLLCLRWVVFTAGVCRAERLPVRVYTTADGLSSSAVNWVMHDSRGFLWFGTRDGLSRFDGQRFTTCRLGRGASPSIPQIIERRRGASSSFSGSRACPGGRPAQCVKRYWA